MTKFKNSLFSLLLVSIFFTSCNGQIKTEPSKEAGSDQPSITSKNPKLVKTQGTTEHQNIHCSLQDKDGRLWFGTTGEGVYRYDGKEFIQFTKKDGLSSNSIWSILEDTSGNIWFGTGDGISRYDGNTISKIPFTNNFGMPLSQSPENAVFSMLQDKSGTIWFGTSVDVFRYDGKSFSRFLDNIHITNEQHLHLKEIQCFLEDSSGTIWMGSGPVAQEGLIRFDGRSVTASKPNGDGWIRTMLMDKKGNIWSGGRNNGNVIFDGKEFNVFSKKTGIGNAVLVDRSGNIWFNGEERRSTVLTENGISVFDGRAFKNYNTNDGMSKYFVWNMLEDKNGNIWIGTRNCGLYRFDGQTFTRFSE